MTLHEHMTQLGKSLFRWRSYAPLIALILVGMGFIGYHYPFDSHMLDEIWETGCLLLSMSGLAVRVLTVGYVPSGTSGRTIARMKAEQLNTTGAYSLMRHPLYVGNFLICLGWSLFFREWYIVIIAALLYWMYYERIIMAEEKHLAEQFGERFERWSTGTPAVFPRLKSWRKPSLPFSLRTVLRREHSTFFVIILVFTVLELIDHTIVERRFHFDVQWIVIFASGVLVYLVLRTLKNYTELLHVAGR